MSEKLQSANTVFEKLILTTKEYKISRLSESEISYNGNMYDIKSAILIDDKVHLLVINDKLENYLIEIINKLVKNSHNPNNKAPNQYKQLVSLTFIQSNSFYPFFTSEYTINLSYELFFPMFFEKSDVASPPPKSC